MCNFMRQAVLRYGMIWREERKDVGRVCRDSLPLPLPPALNPNLLKPKRRSFFTLVLMGPTIFFNDAALPGSESRSTVNKCATAMTRGDRW